MKLFKVPRSIGLADMPVFLFIGPPGVGKGTIAPVIAGVLALPGVAVGDVLPQVDAGVPRLRRSGPAGAWLACDDDTARSRRGHRKVAALCT